MCNQRVCLRSVWREECVKAIDAFCRKELFRLANNNIHLYTAHITCFHGGLQFCKGDIGRQHKEGASGCRFSPTHPDQCTQRQDHNTGNHVPYSLRTVSGFFNVPQRVITNKGCEMGPVYRHYPSRKSKHLQMSSQRHTKNY